MGSNSVAVTNAVHAFYASDEFKNVKDYHENWINQNLKINQNLFLSLIQRCLYAENARLDYVKMKKYGVFIYKPNKKLIWFH